MTQQFTASEVRAEAHRHANEVEDMLNAFADLLEAQEKAGFVVIERGALNRMLTTRDFSELMLAAHCAQAQPPAASVTECDFTTDEVNECFDHLVDDGPRLIPIEAIQQMREHCSLAAQENPNG